VLSPANAARAAIATTATISVAATIRAAR